MRNNIIKEMLQDKKQAGIMFTQYERFGRITKDEVKEYIKDELKITVLDYLEIYNQYLEENGDNKFLPMTELDEFLDNFTGSEGFRMSFFGKICLTDDFFTLDGYGNIKTLTEWELLKHMRNDEDFLTHLSESIFEELTKSEVEELTEAGNLALAAGW